jgi:hypothetical protein
MIGVPVVTVTARHDNIIDNNNAVGSHHLRQAHGHAHKMLRPQPDHPILFNCTRDGINPTHMSFPATWWLLSTG